LPSLVIGVSRRLPRTDHGRGGAQALRPGPERGPADVAGDPELAEALTRGKAVLG